MFSVLVFMFKDPDDTTSKVSSCVESSYCFTSISHSCQRSNNIVFEIYCPKPIRGPEFQLSKSNSRELYWEQAVSVPAPLNANELHLSTPTWRALPAMHHSQEDDATYASGSMH